VLARALAERLTQSLGQTVIVETGLRAARVRPAGVG